MREPSLDNRKVRSLRRLRVLVVARDRRFVRVAGFLLARNGLDVQTLRRTNDLLDAVDRYRTDVVILDATDGLSSAAQSISALEALYPHITVVVVADDPAPDAPSNLKVFPKWTSLEQLALNLEAMHLGLRSVS